MDRRKFIPSMFHRRLVLIAAVMVAVLLLMGLQLVRLAVLEGPWRLEEAEARLDRRTFLPTYRGRILDRHGRVLAQDRASYDVAVDYSVITGAWEIRQAARQARREIGAAQWGKMSPEARDDAIDLRRPQWQARTERLWRAVCDMGELDQADLDRRLDLIRREVQSVRADVWHRQRQRAIEKFGMEAVDGFQPQPIREERDAHVVLPRVSDDVAFRFRALDRDLPDMLEVRDSRRRDHPWSSAEVRLDRSSVPEPIRGRDPVVIRVDGVADHTLGSVRDEVWEEDLQRRPFWRSRPDGTSDVDFGGYRVGDRVGNTGLEYVFENHLRGLRGEIRERKDTGARQRIEPVPGRDLATSLDVRLQARVQAILSPEYGLAKVQQWQAGWHGDGTPKPTKLPLGTPLNSAAVVIQLDSGEILAAVSMPTLAMGEEMTEAARASNQVLVNRPFEAVHPPGSIIKPLVLSAAVSERVHHLDSVITCTGHYFPERKDIARCWIYREAYGFQTHGPLQAIEGLARSCNIFFYTLGDRLGMATLAAWYDRFGLGRPLDVGLLHEIVTPDGERLMVGESAGDVPSDEIIADLRERGELRFASVIMGIGQGPVTWTPIQAANAYATIARGGVIRDASLLLNDPRGPRPRRCADLQLDPALVSTVLEGLRQSVEESFGTGHHIRYADRHIEPIFNAPGVTVWAKTGTAQAPPIDRDGDGRIQEEERHFDHAWTVGLVGPKDDRPRFAIAVVVELGGSGGRVAGPITNQIIRALQDEGYLARGDDAA